MIFLAQFTVEGIPAPQGSKSLMPNGRLIEGSSDTGRRKHKNWRAAVKAAAIEHRDSQPFDGPLAISITFRFPMPKTRPAATRHRGYGWHCVLPDKDKACRSTFDGLEAGRLIANDARFARIEVDAIEVRGWTGAEITIHQLTDDDLAAHVPAGTRAA